MPDEMLFKNAIFTHLLSKHSAFETNYKNVRSITKSDPAIQIEPTPILLKTASP